MVHLSEAEAAKILKGKIPTKKKQSKYHNVKMYEYADGFASKNKLEQGHGSLIACFDSTKEFNRWKELQLLQHHDGQISDLQRQIRLVIQEGFKYNGKSIRAITYVADFCYLRDGVEVIEDVKPFDVRKQKYNLTKDFSLKWRLLMYKYPEKRFEIY